MRLWRHDDRHRPHHRFRQPGHPADRAAGARGRRLFRDRPVPARPRRRSARLKPKAVILSGGPASALPRPAARARRRSVFEAGVPVLGICYGQQTMCAQLGGKVEGGTTASSAAPSSRSSRTAALFDGSVSDRRAPPGLDEPRRPRHRAAAGLRGRRPLGERALRRDRRRGAQDLRHHVPPRGGAHAGRRQAARRTSCTTSPASTATGRWPPTATQAVAAIREQVGKGRVICGLSGGVDSSVAAVLIHEAIGDQLTCIFVDHGLMRQNEAEEVVDAVPRPLQHPARPRRRAPTASSARWQARPTRRRSARPSAGCSSRCSRRRRRSSAAPISWRRARSIPT